MLKMEEESEKETGLRCGSGITGVSGMKETTKKKSREKRKNRLLAVLIILAMLLVSALFAGMRLKAMGFGIYETEDLADAFREAVPSGEEAYTDVVVTENGEVAVCVGYYGRRYAARYLCYRKLPVGEDLWFTSMGTEGQLTTGSPDRREAVGETDVFITLNLEQVNRYTVTENGKTREVQANPDEPLAVFVTEDVEDMTFYTENGEEIAKEDMIRWHWVDRPAS